MTGLDCRDSINPMLENPLSMFSGFPKTPREWQEVHERNTRERSTLFRFFRSVSAYTHGEDQTQEWQEIANATSNDVFSIQPAHIKKFTAFVNRNDHIRELVDFMAVPEEDLGAMEQDPRVMHTLYQINSMCSYLNWWITLRGDFGQGRDELMSSFSRRIGTETFEYHLKALDDLGQEQIRAIKNGDFGYGPIFLTIARGFGMD